MTTLQDAAQGLLSKEPEGQPETEEKADLAETEVKTDEETDIDPDEDQDTDGEELEADDEDGEPEDETDEEDPDEDDDPEIEITTKRGSETVKLSELQAGYLRQKDYTQKTQALTAEKNEFNSEREQVQTALKQQYAQLQEALATFAIDQEPEPDWDSLEGADYVKAQKVWNKKQSQKEQAKAMFQQLQAQQYQQTAAREMAALLEVYPEWRDPAARDAARTTITSTASKFGFTEDEVGSIVDHRMIRVLDRLATLEKAAETQKTNAAKVQKRVAKAAKKPAPGSKPVKNQSEKQERQKKLDRLKKTHSLRDAAAAIIME